LSLLSLLKSNGQDFILLIPSIPRARAQPPPPCPAARVQSLESSFVSVYYALERQRKEEEKKDHADFRRRLLLPDVARVSRPLPCLIRPPAARCRRGGMVQTRRSGADTADKADVCRTWRTSLRLQAHSYRAPASVVLIRRGPCLFFSSSPRVLSLVATTRRPPYARCPDLR